MNDTKQENIVEENTLDIYPLGKGKRIVLFICDLIIFFFMSFFLLNVAAYPIGKASSNYDARVDESDAAACKMDDVLIGNKLLFYDLEPDRHDFDANLFYTAKCFAGYFVGGYPQYSNCNVIKNYFVDIPNRGGHDAYVRALRIGDEHFNFFDFSNDEPVLKAKYREQFEWGLPVNSQESMSEEGQKNFNIFTSKIFVNAYKCIFDDVAKNDLIYDGISFNENQKVVVDVNKYMDVLTISVTFISMFLSGLICFLIIPLCNKNGKTIAMAMLRIERVGIDNIFLLKKSEVALMSIYQFAASLGGAIFLPMTFISFTHVFSMPVLIVVSLLSFLIALTSLFFILFNKYNRSLFDILSRTSMITTDSLNDIYRAKGYKV